MLTSIQAFWIQKLDVFVPFFRKHNNTLSIGVFAKNDVQIFDAYKLKSASMFQALYKKIIYKSAFVHIWLLLINSILIIIDKIMIIALKWI